ncbi:thiamine phosphate synthase [Curtanaerobium respiraculi]|uniref:thiamine phosphate synthase n=1 Tax=Curtanaerobium respiraculi TaxID=2949669 RepID=UPI0024B36C07|nr:thiamine phosphate synthase [Curtanaerobium respiraculi]
MHKFVPEDLLCYAVTDSAWLGGRTLPECVRQAIEGGCTFVQLREKDAGQERIVALAREIKPICEAAGVPFVIDDDVQAAREVGCDGVHVGQSDEGCASARRTLGPDAIIGVSAQTVAEAQAAEAAGADYLGVGALFGTTTKLDAGDLLTAGRFAEICRSVSIPVVCIGGLNAGNLPRIKGLGASGAAVVSAIFAADDCGAAAAELRAVCDTVF